MKKGIHPEYRDVVFKDVSADYEVLTRSTVKTTDKITYQGKEYPLFLSQCLQNSYSSHIKISFPSTMYSPGLLNNTSETSHGDFWLHR